ncbi:MAG: hypothetical protein GKR91_19755 [Pseudomonadales bacterium]|nr:hypothetical protein [Pseudomonadales bacterium]
MKEQQSVNAKQTLHRLLLFNFVATTMVVISQNAFAQDVPADLLDLSIEELFEANIREENPTGSGISPLQGNKWRFAIQYQRSEFEGYFDGSDKLSLDEVSFIPGTEARTADNFPVVPAMICQNVKAFTVAYELNDRVSLQMVVPHVEQSTDHFSSVPGYERFVIDSKGIGDVTLLGTYRLSGESEDGWLLGLGVSLPTGSIDEEGDTPRAPGNQQLPYSMQLGSGTFDIPLNIAYSRNMGSYSWGAELSGRFRLGENDRNYSLGDRASVSSWLRLNSIDWLRPSLRLRYEYSGDISGIDDELLVPGPFAFPAPVTNPTMYGGSQATVSLGFAVPVHGATQLNLEFGKPFYQSLNGPQVGEDYQFSASLNFSF